MWRFLSLFSSLSFSSVFCFVFNCYMFPTSSLFSYQPSTGVLFTHCDVQTGEQRVHPSFAAYRTQSTVSQTPYCQKKSGSFARKVVVVSLIFVY